MKHMITIPKPCSENWNEMTPTQKGAFCKSCEKEVIDFTQTTKIELSRKLKKGDDLCGRFTPSQLNTPLPSVSRNQWKRNAALLGFTTLLAVTTPLAAQDTAPHPTEQVPRPIIMGRIAHKPVVKTITVNGNIQGFLAANQKAHITLVGTVISTTTDMEGNFSLEIPANELQNEASLRVMAIGYELIEIKITEKTTFVSVKLEEELLQIMGEIEIHRVPSKMDEVKRLFRKK